MYQRRLAVLTGHLATSTTELAASASKPPQLIFSTPTSASKTSTPTSANKISSPTLEESLQPITDPEVKQLCISKISCAFKENDFYDCGYKLRNLASSFVEDNFDTCVEIIKSAEKFDEFQASVACIDAAEYILLANNPTRQHVQRAQQLMAMSREINPNFEKATSRIGSLNSQITHILAKNPLPKRP